MTECTKVANGSTEGRHRRALIHTVHKGNERCLIIHTRGGARNRTELADQTFYRSCLHTGIIRTCFSFLACIHIFLVFLFVTLPSLSLSLSLTAARTDFLVVQQKLPCRFRLFHRARKGSTASGGGKRGLFRILSGQVSCGQRTTQETTRQRLRTRPQSSRLPLLLYSFCLLKDSYFLLLLAHRITPNITWQDSLEGTRPVVMVLLRTQTINRHMFFAF